jgi:hypothetical protein
MRGARLLVLCAAVFFANLCKQVLAQSQIGKEISMPFRLAEGQEFELSLADLVEHGRRLFSANWTIQEGGGRPLTKGTGGPVATPGLRLEFPRNFNRVSAPDANSCAGCHNAPLGIVGGGGDIVANVFVLGHRFDFATFNPLDTTTTGGIFDEQSVAANLQNIANSRNTLGMFGSGFIEMLARQITTDLQAIRNTISPGRNAQLVSKGISFGTLARNVDGTWNTSAVVGLATPSLASDPPSLIVRPFHQAGAVISLRQFTNNAMNHHHGIQPTERFPGDPDDDGFVDEMSQADVTAVTIFQATMAVPGRVIPRDPEIEAAIRLGEQRFLQIGCVSCHIPKLPLVNEGWVFTEPNPFNPPGNRKAEDGPIYRADLTSPHLPSPRLQPERGVVWVPAFTDLRLHDLCDGPDDPNMEPIDMHAPAGSASFFAGNRRFITRKLWGTANEAPYFHHGQFTTLREAIFNHGGEAAAIRTGFMALPAVERDAVIEFLKSLQVLPLGSRSLIVDERGRPRNWKSIF